MLKVPTQMCERSSVPAPRGRRTEEPHSCSIIPNNGAAGGGAVQRQLEEH